MSKTTNILIAGVGGQGTLLASKLMGKVFTEQGYDVKVSEVHGMSQRGGSVITYVRYGVKVHSALIETGEADILLSFEQLEAARWLPYLRPDGLVITNTQKINPMTVITGAAEYPEGVLSAIEKTGVKLKSIDAFSLAVAAGSEKCVNTVLVGVFAAQSGIDKQVWLDAIRSTVPAKTVELNLKAFESGFNS